MAFSRLLASWLLLVKMRRSPLQPLVPHQGDSSPRPHWAFCPISVSSNPASTDLIASLPRLPGDVPTMMSLPNSHGGTYMLLSLSLCQEHLRGHALCDLYIRPVAWLWFSMWQRGNWDWAVDSLTNFRDSPGIYSSQSGSKSRLHPLSGSLKLLFLGPVHNLLQNTTQMNTSTR